MEDIKELTLEDVDGLSWEELAEKLLEMNQIAVKAQKTAKEKEQGASKIATEFNELKWSIWNIVQQELEAKEVSEKRKAVLESIPEANKEVFEATFNELKGETKLTPTNLNKFVKSTLANLSDDDAEAIKSQAVGNSVWSPKAVSQTVKYAEKEKQLWMELFWDA